MSLLKPVGHMLSFITASLHRNLLRKFSSTKSLPKAPIYLENSNKKCYITLKTVFVYNFEGRIRSSRR